MLRMDQIKTPANIVTLTRICLVPVFVVALLSPWPSWLGIDDLVTHDVKSVIAAVVFIVISCSDWIDGYLARKRNEVTDFGKFVDPLADKILVAAALLALVELQVLPSWPVLIILAREFIVSGVRMLAASKGIIIAASRTMTRPVLRAKPKKYRPKYFCRYPFSGIYQNTVIQIPIITKTNL